MAVHIKNGVLAAIATVGTFIANALGGWDAANQERIAAIEDALCDMDEILNGGAAE